ncbi:peptidyl-glycine alpha-amidating monooxygenase B-like [Gigantopelta aegis]|uniref:peptidyl-glycine alpha-amidating monooxygenase B-like n=1 Tax=Gigantopelta aegis TaxID=1735272 RepID=UPI001B88A45A|nr:peptidyl-glycine alpha-amidating monooxygenase B-like [Gigantopelta aegis]
MDAVGVHLLALYVSALSLTCLCVPPGPSTDLPQDVTTMEIKMKDALPSKDDDYLCSSYTAPAEEHYIVKFEAMADVMTAHHILLFGCEGAPYSDKNVWNCPGICGPGLQQKILFAWAKNAPPTKLPKDVGFRLGGSKGIQTLVLQVHFKHKFEENAAKDNSGLKLYITKQKQKYVAGIYLLASSSLYIPPDTPMTHADLSCPYTLQTKMYPFAYRTHAHGLGTVITGYQYNDTWHEIGKGNPQWPQAFYPVKDIIEVQFNDILVARCSYNSTGKLTATRAGMTGGDEMCNFYIMFYTDSSESNPYGTCVFNSSPQLVAQIPADSDVPLPPNPLLDEEAKGHHNHGMPQNNDHADELQTIDLKMKGAKPSEPDAYLCAAYKMPADEHYIVKFEAMAEAQIAHHILVFGCEGEEYSTSPIWDCPPVCKDGQEKILFAWAKNAPPTTLPKDVGFRVGGRSGVKTIVLQVHYAHAFEESEENDFSGIKIYLTKQKQTFVAGIFLLMSYRITIPPNTAKVHSDISCEYDLEKTMHPFAYRTHAHGLGRVITGYQYNNSWHEIGKGNPQWPQAFYPVHDMISVQPGDKLVARCTFNSTGRNRFTYSGATGNDEMCNFYIMFYTDSDVKDPYSQCGGNNYKNVVGIMPADSDVPLPPNPLLDEVAKGHHHHHPHHHPQVPPTPVVIPAQNTMELKMKGAKPPTPDAYLCSSYPVSDKEFYIVKFEAMADAMIAHHILVYGCSGQPASSNSIWKCPAICANNEQQKILFAWAKNAPPTVLPHNVGFRVGGNSGIRTLIIQVHYAHAFDASEEKDYSGIRIYLTEEKQKFVAGIFLMYTYLLSIPPNTPMVHSDISCMYQGENPMYPFAYRTHAHGLGRVITGYQYNNTWHEIGKGNPQWPQAFYPVHDKISVNRGDKLVARCSFNSTGRNRYTHIGQTGADEMCNFYIMAYMDSSTRNPYGSCGGNKLPLLVENIPDDSDVPLPPNPLLDDAARGHHHFQHGSGGGMTSDLTNLHLTFDSSWPQQSVTIGQVGGVAVDTDGNVYIFHRGTRVWDANSFDVYNHFQLPNAIPQDTIVIYHKNGKLIRKFGSNSYFMPHGMEVDSHGNMWITDVALHQVMRIPAGAKEPDLVLGERFTPGNDDSHFCKPTDVAVLSTGEFYVADGYCNSRIMKFSKDGKLIKQWGHSSFEVPPPSGSFTIPHSITAAEDRSLVCVADRENGRVQCFDLDGTFRNIIKVKEFGDRLFAIDYCPLHGGLLFAVNGPSIDGEFVKVSGFTLNFTSGSIIEVWTPPQGLANPHDVCVDSVNHAVYVGELDPSKVWRMQMESAQNIVSDGPSGNTKTLTVNKPSKKSDFTPSVIIGVLLVVPVVILLIVMVTIKLYHSGKIKCFSRGKNPKVFSLQNILPHSHKGFDRLSMEESDHEADPLDDSDQEEYTAPRKQKA